MSCELRRKIAKVDPGLPLTRLSPMRVLSFAQSFSAFMVLCSGCSGVRPLVPPPSDSLACTDDAAIDVLHHDIELSLQLEPPSLVGRGTVRLKLRCPTTRVELDARLIVSAVTLDARPLPFRAEDGRLRIELPQRLQSGAEVSLQMTWEVPTDGTTPTFFSDQVWAGYHAAAWLPTRQDPAQRATLALRILAPAELKVAASGRALVPESIPGARTKHSFVLDRPAPPFLYAFAAGRFAEASLEVDGFRLRALGPAGGDLTQALAATAQAYRFLYEKLQTHLPEAVYSQVFVRGDAAQEAAGIALLGAAFLADLGADPKEDWVFSHELAHQWFAWLVPCADFADFWLNEGLATFLVAAIKEQRWGKPAYERELGLWRERSAKVHRAGRDQPISLSAPGVPRRPPPTDALLQPRGVTYARGALALHRLRGELGEEIFWNGLRLYVKEHAGRGARTEDLRRAMEVASGTDLRGFFARWVYAPAPDI